MSESQRHVTRLPRTRPTRLTRLLFTYEFRCIQLYQMLCWRQIQLAILYYPNVLYYNTIETSLEKRGARTERYETIRRILSRWCHRSKIYHHYRWTVQERYDVSFVADVVYYNSDMFVLLMADQHLIYINLNIFESRNLSRDFDFIKISLISKSLFDRFLSL